MTAQDRQAQEAAFRPPALDGFVLNKEHVKGS
jgi:hypothetical protein